MSVTDSSRLGLIENFLDGQTATPEGEEFSIYSPLSGEVIGRCRASRQADVDRAATVAAQAQCDWGRQTFKQRSQVLFNYRELLRRHRKELAEICHLENGKTIAEALAGADKALELVDFACSLPALISGQVQQVSRGVECRSEYRPLGVTASITPFNFPIMVPHWTTPLVLALGNSVILKPSELTPATANRMAELWQEAGLPNGLLNIVHGGREAVEAICRQPMIRAVSFVGSTPVAEKVFRLCSNHNKRVATFGGAKNHIVLLPDAHFEMACADIVASFTGMSGQRCMAASTLIAVGQVEGMIEEIVARASALVPGKDLPPMISAAACQRIGDYLDRVQAAGAKILVDGRQTVAAGLSGGYYLGASVIDYRQGGQMPKEEIFGPTLEIVAADRISQALDIQRASPYGNAASVFTQNGRHAAEFASQFEAGMVGVNIGIPVPRDPFSFGGIKGSHFGYADITGMASLPLWTTHRKITTKWNAEDKVDWMS